MTDQGQRPLQSAELHKVLGLISDLNRSPQGAVLYDQVYRMLRQYESGAKENEQALCSVIGLLLDSLSVHLIDDSALFTRVQILKRQFLPPFSPNEMHVLRRTIEHLADHLTQQNNVNLGSVEYVLKPLLSAYGMMQWDVSSGVSRSWEKEAAKYDSTARTAEARIMNKGMDVVMGSLKAHDKISEGLNKSKEFGKLLELELSTLKAIDDIELFDEKKNAIVSELENLLRDHQQITRYFDHITQYLNMVKDEGERLNQELTRVTTLSLTDELTGLPNRRAFAKRLEDEISRAQRYGSSLVIALIDLDHFKPINDTYGHAAGDAVLRLYSNEVLTAFRQNDMIARYGGEEFAVIFPNTTLEGAHRAINKVQKRAAELTLNFEGVNIPLPTFSGGLIDFIPGESLESAMQRVDEALYAAKKGGRNRVEVVNSKVASAEE